MPKFKKSAGYKMKGFSGFKSSPAKQTVTAADIRGAVSKVNRSKSRTDKDGKFIQPSWAQGLSAALESFGGMETIIKGKANKALRAQKEDEKVADKKAQAVKNIQAMQKEKQKEKTDKAWDDYFSRP